MQSRSAKQNVGSDDIRQRARWQSRDFEYGSPQLRGNKLALEEGGIRLGLSAWYGSGSKLGSAADIDLQAIRNAITSHVDLLPTIAHAAGCQPDSYGRYAVGVCNESAEGPRDVCTQNSDCPGSYCENHILAGRTILPLLSDTVKDYNEVTSARKYAFAERKTSDPAIVSAPVNDAETPAAANPCGLREEASDRALTLTPARDAGSIQIPSIADPCGSAPKLCTGGKCGGVPTGSICTKDEDCQTCVSNGKFCVPSEAVTHCGLTTAGSVVDYELCEWTTYRRCNTTPQDCKHDPGSNCMQVRKTCSQNSAASWKLRMNSHSLVPTQLFDLTTNPEELEELNFVDVSGASVVKSALLKRLKGWYACVKTGADGADCEYAEQP